SVWHFMTSEGSRKAVEVAERFADGEASWPELREAAGQARDLFTGPHGRAIPHPVYCAMAASACARDAGDARGATGAVEGEIAAKAADATGLAIGNSPAQRQWQVRLLREVFGNPFQPGTIDPAWRTPTVQSLSQGAYSERILPVGKLNKQRLAILADALEEAGCTSADLLSHLRSPGPHVRGCWALDLVLGKE